MTIEFAPITRCSFYTYITIGNEVIEFTVDPDDTCEDVERKIKEAIEHETTTTAM